MARFAFFLSLALGLAAMDFATAWWLADRGENDSPGSSLGIAILIHLVIAAVAGFSPFLLREGPKHSTGRLTLALLAGTLAFLTPILGPLVAIWMVAAPAGKKGSADNWPGIRLGNPSRKSNLGTEAEPLSISMPLIQALRSEHHALPRWATSHIRSRMDRTAVAALHALRDRQDARTQLYAQAAISSVSENREKTLEQLRHLAAEASRLESPDALARWERLASALFETAESQLFGKGEGNSLYQEAAEAYRRALAIAPSDAACLFGLARCSLALEDFDRAPELLGQLTATPGAASRTDELEIRFLARQGRWPEVARSLLDEGDPASSPVRIDSGQWRFWNQTSRASLLTP